MPSARNLLGTELQPCSKVPLTGYYRDGCCHTGTGDYGVHTICAVMTDEFLDYSQEQGNDLITPRPEMQFPGLKAGDRWCICAGRWVDALDAGVAPLVVLEATHISAIEYASKETFEAYAFKSES